MEGLGVDKVGWVLSQNASRLFLRPRSRVGSTRYNKWLRHNALERSAIMTFAGDRSAVAFGTPTHQAACNLQWDQRRFCKQCKQVIGAMRIYKSNCISNARNGSPLHSVGAGGNDGSGSDQGEKRVHDGSDGIEASALLKTFDAVAEDVVVLDVTGMRCAGCVSRVRQILEGEERVIAASVNLATETAVVRVSVPESIQYSALGIDLEEGTGHELEQESVESPYSKALREMGEGLASILSEKGYEASFRPHGAVTSAASKVVQAKRKERLQRLKDATLKVIIAWGLASACMLHHIVHWFGAAAPRWVQILGSTPGTAAMSALAILGPGRRIVVDGMKALMAGAPDMNSLVGLGATAAFGISSIAFLFPRLGWRTFFEEPAMLLGFVLIGRALEERAKIQASADMAALSGLLPPVARLVLSDGTSWREIPSENVSVGDFITVLPGDRIPVDGEVISGRSTVDESSITGESLPVSKTHGDQVTAGTTNFDGTLMVKATAAGGDAAVSNILALVEKAQSRAAPIQRVADVVAGKFTYGVMAAAAATFIFWSGIGTRIFPQVLEPYLHTGTAKLAASLSLSLQLACSVLVVACPCALGLAAPTAVLVGTSAGARKGLLVRGGDILESASNVNTVVFDKTGTLTTGRPKVVNTSEFGTQYSVLDMLSFASAIEEKSTHPIALAITDSAAKDPAVKRRILDEGTFHQVPGRGAEGSIQGTHVCVGNLDWVVEKTSLRKIKSKSEVAQSGEIMKKYNGPLDPGHTTVYIGIEGSIAGVFEIADQIRPDAIQVIEKLKKSGIRTIMLSGDQEPTAKHVATQLGIATENVISGVTPEGKVQAVRKLQSQGSCVAMVGDGVNDAAALAEADVGIAMGGGVAVASEVADIVLLGDRLSQVLETLKLSDMTISTIKQNMAWAFGYNLICLPLAAGALLPTYGIGLTPALSGALMGCSSLAVMANSLLLQRRAH